MKTPTDTVNKLIQAINGGNIDEALALYEPNATMVAQPGKVARGTQQVRDAIAAFIALKPVLRYEEREVFETGEQALYISRWNLRGKDSSGKDVTMSGESTDVLRKQSDGRWLIAIDNPWGVQTLHSGERK